MPPFTVIRRASRSYAPLLVAAALVALLTGLTSAAQVSTIPTADAFVAAAEPDSNYGGAGSLAASAPGLPNGEFQSLLRFDLASARSGFDAEFGAGGWMLESASLRLTTSNPNNAIFNANAAGPVPVGWMQNDGWVEGTGTPINPASDGVTFNTLSSFVSPGDESVGTISFPGGNSGANTYALDLTSGFAADLMAGGATSLRLSAGGSASYNFASRSFGTTSSRPMLTLTAIAVPEPAAGIVLLAAAASFLSRRRTK